MCVGEKSARAFFCTYEAVQLMEDLQDTHVACADVFRDVLQVVGFRPVEARNLVLGNLDAMLWKRIRQSQE